MRASTDTKFLDLSEGSARLCNGNKMSHLVAAELRKRIVRGQIAPGDALPPEAELVHMLNVSRDTLRAALRVLESESLITIRRGRHGGAVVRRPDLRAISRYVALLLQTRGVRMEEVNEARRVLELPAVAMLAEQHHSPRATKLLADLRRRQGSPPDNLVSLVSLIGRFDQTVANLAGNRIMSLLTGIFRDVSAAQLYSALQSGGLLHPLDRLRALFDQQDAFLDAIADGASGDALVSLWRGYLGEVSALLTAADFNAKAIDVTPIWRAERGVDGSELYADKAAAAIAVEVRSRIVEGRLNSGDKLAALPELALEFGVSRPTLREALRILERESLLDLRTGPCGGAHVRIPTTQTAAQLAAIVIECQQTTIGDLWEARCVIEPELVGLTAERIDAGTLHQLRDLMAPIESAVADTPRFTKVWGEAEQKLLASTGNPAITVAVELSQWVRESCQTELTADAVNLPWVERSNRRAARRFEDVLNAAMDHDGDAASAAWNDFVRFTTPFFQNLGDRLILDMLD